MFVICLLFVKEVEKNQTIKRNKIALNCKLDFRDWLIF